ncbi:MAG: condensation domain-containing protein, partial [Ferruginibacter sp.]
MRKELEVELSIKDLFSYPTIAELAVHLHGQDKVTLLPSIPAQPRPEKIPLSFSQERLWFIDQLEGSLQYHVPSVLRLKGDLNTSALEDAIRTIVDRHQVLRTVFRYENAPAYQFVIEKEGWHISLIDGSGFIDKPNELRQFKKELISKRFDLSNDYMLRAALIKLDEQDHLMVVTIHHIASDGWSTSILVKELVELYNAFEEQRLVNLDQLPLQYVDFAIWQRNYLEGEVLNKKMAYWKKKLDQVPPLQFPTDFSRPAVWSTNGSIEVYKIDKGLVGRLQELSQQKSSTLFMTLLAAFKVLMYRYSGQEDICIGTPIAGRQQHELEGLIGFFVNTLALRTEVKGEATFIEFLQQVRTVTLEAYENQEAPFEKVVDEVVTERDISRNPLFQVMFVMRNTPEIPALRLGNVLLSSEPSEHTSAMFDIQVFLTETPDGLIMATEYCTDLFSSTTINRMMAHFKELLSSIVKNPQQKISDLSMLTATEEQQLLFDLNNTKASYAIDKNVVGYFEEQVLKTPEAIAVIFEESQFTYTELNQHANRLA